MGRYGLLWIHDDNPMRPHALLTSEKHSNGFFNGGKLLFDMPRLARIAVEDLVEMGSCVVKKPDIVIGPAFGAVTLARDVADAYDTAFGFTVPVGGGADKIFILEKRFAVADKIVLLVEDTITTGDSISKTCSAVERPHNGIVLPYIFALCNRSGKSSVDGRQIIALIDKEMPTWDEKDCPYCEIGSEAIRPKEAGNWALLNASY